MSAKIIAFMPRYLRATAEASLVPPGSPCCDLTMDHVDALPFEMSFPDTSPCEYVAPDFDVVSKETPPHA